MFYLFSVVIELRIARLSLSDSMQGVVCGASNGVMEYICSMLLYLRLGRDFFLSTIVI